MLSRAWVGTATVDVTMTDDATAGGAALTTAVQSFTISQVAATDANLGGFAVNTATVSPAFSAAVTSYTSSVPYATSSLTVTPTSGDGYSTLQVRVNGGSLSSVASGGTSASLPLNVGSNTIDIVVKAQDGSTTKTYSVAVTRAPSSDATLGGFALSGPTTATPAFNATVTSYAASVAHAMSSITVTPTSGDGLSTMQVRVNGGALSTVASGSESGSLALNVGDNPIDVIVTAQDGTTTKTYTITVTRAPSSDATLSGFALSGPTTATPAFSPAGTSYAASVAHAMSSITVTPTSGDGLSTIQVRVNGGALSTVASGATSAQPGFERG